MHDLAASKLAAYREKDRDFVRLLLIEKLIEARILSERIRKMELEENLSSRLIAWIQNTSEELQ